MYGNIRTEKGSACPISTFVCRIRAGFFIYKKMKGVTSMKKIKMINLMNLGNTWDVPTNGTFGLSCLFDGAILNIITVMFPFGGIDIEHIAYRRDPHNYRRYGTGTPILI